MARVQSGGWLVAPARACSRASPASNDPPHDECDHDDDSGDDCRTNLEFVDRATAPITVRTEPIGNDGERRIPDGRRDRDRGDGTRQRNSNGAGERWDNRANRGQEATEKQGRQSEAIVPPLDALLGIIAHDAAEPPSHPVSAEAPA